VYEACKTDQLRLCPSFRDPWTENQLFSASCFRQNLNALTPQCKIYYEKYMLNRHFVFGIFISGSIIVMAAGMLTLLTVCCCVACCVRVCMKRRCQAKCGWRKTAQQIHQQDSTELATCKSINYDQLQQEEEAMPQPQFVFAPGQFPPPPQVFSPYPQYIPVYVAQTEEQQQ